MPRIITEHTITPHITTIVPNISSIFIPLLLGAYFRMDNQTQSYQTQL